MAESFQINVLLTAGLALAALACLVAAMVSMRREPRRIVNGFLIEAAVVLLFLVAVSVSEPGGPVFMVLEVLLLVLDVLLFILAIALIVDFFYVVRHEGLSIPNLLPLAFGLLIVVVGVVGYIDTTSGISGSKTDVFIMSVLFNVALYVPLAIGAVLICLVVYQMIPKKPPVSFIVVLGCAIRKDGTVTPLLRGRLDRALLWWRGHGEQASFITSGGQGSDEVVSESLAMKNYLLEQGVPENKILMEDASTSTRENILFSQRIADENGGDACGPLLLCTSNYHVLRAVLLAKKLGSSAQGIGGHTALYYLPVAFFREYIAFIFSNKPLVAVYVGLAILMALPDLLA